MLCSSADFGLFSRLRRSLGVFLLAPLVACGSESPVAPGQPGSIIVSVQTTSPFEPFVIQNMVHIGLDSAVISETRPAPFVSVAPGPYEVTLSGVPNSCDVVDGPTRMVSIVDGERVEVRFIVRCLPRLRDQIVLSDYNRLWAVNPDGSALVRLTDFDLLTMNFPASVSPDGATLVFSAVGEGDGSVNLYAQSFDGGPPARLTPDPPGDDRSPSWSPDGTRVAFVAAHSTGSNLVVMDVATKVQTPLTADGDYPAVWSTSWSPDGQEIAFTFLSDNGEWLSGSMGSDGGNARQFSLPGETRWASWAPDGNSLAVAHRATTDEPYQLWLMSPAGLLISQITDDAATHWFPIWAPDGTRLAVEFDPQGPSEPAGAWVMNRDGSERHLLLDGGPWVPVAWAPAGP